MLVKLRNDRTQNNYFSLEQNVQYRVLAAASQLSNNTCEVLLVRSESEYPHIASVSVDSVEVIDDTPEDDWIGRVLTYDNTSEPTLIMGFSALGNDPSMYVRLHDLNEAEDDMKCVWAVYKKYGENKVDSTYNPIAESDFMDASNSIAEYYKNGLLQSDHGYIYIKEHALDYIKNVERVARYVIDKISNTTNVRECVVYAIRLQRLVKMIAIVSAVDRIDVPTNLLSLSKNLSIVSNETYVRFVADIQSGNRYGL